MAGYEGPIIDTDVHHQVKRDADVVAYLPREWRDYLASNRDARARLGAPAGGGGTLLPSGGMLGDSYPADGSRPGSDYPTMKEQLLDRYPIHRAVLCNIGAYDTHFNHYFASALCSAVNDWNVDHWLDLGDARIYSVMSVPWAMPDDAVAEIKRMAGHPRMVGVLLTGNPIGRPIGDPIFHPILKAIAEEGLVLVAHPGTSDRPNHHVRSVGEKAGATDLWPHSIQSGLHYTSSLIANGVFEKYPDLRVLFNEYGVGQIPSFVWRFDSMYEVLKLESRWVRRRPSEYLHDHVRFSTQPLEDSRDDKGAIGDLLRSLDGAEDILCFSSDYPHISFDEPVSIQRLLPKAWYRKVFCDNAADLFRWPRPAEPTAGRVAHVAS